MRALAVLVVTIFHLWPSLLPGGFIGVDVFFVLSGYLITQLLLKELATRGKIDLVRFYKRRYKRLMPVAAVVLVATALLTILFVPESEWRGYGAEIVASALYFENWWLAQLSVDYLATDAAPSALQHFWSLSVEEQFYLFWPALMIGSYGLAKRGRFSSLAALGTAFGAVFALSLLASIWLSAVTPAPAYFYSHTRVWELALGGLVALIPISLPRLFASVLGPVGIVAILLSAAFFGPDTRFPGFAALLPALGAACVIAAGAHYTGPAQRLLSNRPAQFLGDHSYSIYLWHWPIIVISTIILERPLGAVDGIVIFAVTVLLSMASKRWVEDVFRESGRHGARAPTRLSGMFRRSALILSSVAPVVLGAVLIALVSQDLVEAPEAQYPGALSIGASTTVPEMPFLPSLAAIRSDQPDVYERGCHLGFEDSEPVGCDYGNPASDYQIMLVGDSHAAHWVPALTGLATAHGLSLTAYSKSACPFTVSSFVSNEGQNYPSCIEFAGKMLDMIKSNPPDLLIISQSRRNVDAQERDGRSMAEGLEDLLNQLKATGTKVVAFADTPRVPYDTARCLDDNSCGEPSLSDGLDYDPMAEAAANVADVGFIDLNDLLCPDEVCPPIIGNVVVWRDSHHITATYSRTTWRALDERLAPFMNFSR